MLPEAHRGSGIKGHRSRTKVPWYLAAELEAELRCEDEEKSTQELGDFLFSVINAARLYHLNPDNALEYANQKFIRRFNYIEEQAKEHGKMLKDMTLGEMDELWNEAKEMERKQ